MPDPTEDWGSSGGCVWTCWEDRSRGGLCGQDSFKNQAAVGQEQDFSPCSELQPSCGWQGGLPGSLAGIARRWEKGRGRETCRAARVFPFCGVCGETLLQRRYFPPPHISPSPKPSPFLCLLQLKNIKHMKHISWDFFSLPLKKENQKKKPTPKPPLLLSEGPPGDRGLRTDPAQRHN